MNVETAAAAQTALFPFAFLVYEENSPRWGRTWVARSVLTGHLAEARTADGAVANLQRTIDASIWMAMRLGQTPREWYDTQPMDDPRHVAMFCRLVSRGVERRLFPMKSGNCQLETSIATSHAA